MAKSRNAGIQSRNNGGAKKIDKIKIKDEAKSIPLRRSPVNMNNPFKNNSPAQKSKILVFTSNPKIIIRNNIAETKSIAPRAFTIIRKG